jgi:hypothetical protein
MEATEAPADDARHTGIEWEPPSNDDSSIDLDRSPRSAPAPSATWENRSGTGDLRISIDQEIVTFGPHACPIVVVGAEVWDVTNGRFLQTLQGEYKRYGTVKSALSANGRLFAANLDADESDRELIGIWNTATGEQLQVIDAGEEHSVDLMLLSLDKYLIVGGRKSNQLRLWDATTGAELDPIKTPCDRIDAGKIAFTADGEYFASIAEQRLVVIKTKTKRTAAVMAAPRQMDRSGKGQALIVRNNRVVADSRRSAGNDAVFVFAWLRAMQFSPDSDELAAFSTHPRPRLMCWSNRGRLVYDEPLYQMPRITSGDHSIQWLPDRSGWLVSGNIIDRETKRVVFAVRQTFGRNTYVYALDKDRLLGAFPHNPDELEVLQVPWEQIRVSLKLLEENAPALLGPAQPVSVNIVLGNLRGDQSETFRILGEALQLRLARDGLCIEPGQTTYFQLRFSEESGDQLPVYERQSPFDFRGHNTGRSVTEAKGALVVELIGNGELLWRDSIKADSARSFHGEINDAVLRRSMLDSVNHQIAELNFPYFIPVSRENLALPVVIE